MEEPVARQDLKKDRTERVAEGRLGGRVVLLHPGVDSEDVA